jgi:hypothetical protein
MAAASAEASTALSDHRTALDPASAETSILSKSLLRAARFYGESIRKNKSPAPHEKAAVDPKWLANSTIKTTENPRLHGWFVVSSLSL